MFKQNTDEMSKSVSDIAKEFGFNRYSFSEAFEIPYSEKETINKLSECGICTNIEEMRENLEYAGKRCTLYVGLIDFLEEGINKTKHDIEQNVGDFVIKEKWLDVSQTHRDVYEMLGFLTLLQMDSITTAISLLQAQNDTERIVQSKHAYTIIYEARTHDLFDKVSAGMYKYPEEIVKKDELNTFWKTIKGVLKKMISQKESEAIRNKLDAHKDKSFVDQIALYKKCDWATSIINLFTFISLIDKIELYMDNIHAKLNVLYDHHKAFVEERMQQYEDIMRQLRDLPSNENSAEKGLSLNENI